MLVDRLFNFLVALLSEALIGVLAIWLWAFLLMWIHELISPQNPNEPRMPLGEAIWGIILGGATGIVAAIVIYIRLQKKDARKQRT